MIVDFYFIINQHALPRYENHAYWHSQLNDPNIKDVDYLSLPWGVPKRYIFDSDKIIVSFDGKLKYIKNRETDVYSPVQEDMCWVILKSHDIG